jgi:hypothetical protein
MIGHEQKRPAELLETARRYVAGDRSMDVRELGPVRAGPHVMGGMISEIVRRVVEPPCQRVVGALEWIVAAFIAAVMIEIIHVT